MRICTNQYWMETGCLLLVKILEISIMKKSFEESEVWLGKLHEALFQLFEMKTFYTQYNQLVKWRKFHDNKVLSFAFCFFCPCIKGTDWVLLFQIVVQIDALVMFPLRNCQTASTMSRHSLTFKCPALTW